MELSSLSFSDHESIPERYAFGKIDAQSHVALADNFNPQFSWDDVPAGTQSFALICHDPDVPSRGDDVNQDGKVVPPELPRVDFFHWTLVDLPPDAPPIAAGEFSDGVTTAGKVGPEIFIPGRTAARHGINDYTGWFAEDPNMAGDYYGYDGPCPPWNDSIVHRYIFTLYALAIDRLPVDGRFTGQQARDAMRGHILAEAKIVGIYTLNPAMSRLA